MQCKNYQEKNYNKFVANKISWLFSIYSLIVKRQMLIEVNKLEGIKIKFNT